jgi:tetratricopeptide (TPR) repeat protein
MKGETYIEQVLDDYLYGNIILTDAEKLLKDNSVTGLSEIIALHKAAAVAIQRNAVISQVKKVHQQFVAAKPTATAIADISATKGKIRIISTLKWMAGVAAVFIVFICSWYAYQINTASSSKLYAEMYQTYNVNTDRAGIDDIVTHNMVQQYKDKDYREVIYTYQSLIVTNSREKFLTAMAYQETGSYQPAVDLLEKIMLENKQKETRLYNDEAEFYTALNYLKLKKNESAFPLLQKIYKTPGHTFHERVSKWTITRLKWIK